MPDLYRTHARVIPKSLTYKSSHIDDKKNEQKKLYYTRRINRTHKNIPEHVKNHIESLYHAMQHHLGQEERIRKRQIIAMLKIYYKWENNITLQLTRYTYSRRVTTYPLPYEGTLPTRD